jgi:hypothetical protein
VYHVYQLQYRMLEIQQTVAPGPSQSSLANFTSIFGAVSSEYKKLTSQDLDTHPFAAVLSNCDTPDAVLDVFRKQAEAFDEFRKRDESLMRWLGPTVHVLFTFSATLGEGIGLVRLTGSILHPLHDTNILFS